MFRKIRSKHIPKIFLQRDIKNHIQIQKHGPLSSNNILLYMTKKNQMLWQALKDPQEMFEQRKQRKHRATLGICENHELLFRVR